MWSKRRSGAIMTGLAALLLDEMNGFDAYATLDCLDHVVDGEAGDRDRGERFHFDAGRSNHLHGGLHDATRQVGIGRDVERDLRDRERMTERDKIMGPLGGHDARDSR